MDDDTIELICFKHNLPTMSYEQFIAVGIKVKRIYKLTIEDSEEFFDCVRKYLKTPFGINILKNITHVQNMYYN